MSHHITRAKAEQAWLDENGKQRTDEELRELCQNWTASTWEDYLKALEPEPQEFYLEKPEDVEQMSEEDYVRLLISLTEQEEFPFLRQSVLIALKKLKAREQQVIKLFFWHGKSRVQIAEKLGVTRKTVSRNITKGLKKIKFILENQLIKNNLIVLKNLARPEDIKISKIESQKVRG